jgi:hypothetical protein
LAEQSANDGGKQARSPGSTKETVKTIACGNAGLFSGGPVVTNARVYYTTRAAAGASAPGIPRALYWAENSAQLGRIAPRDSEVVFEIGCLKIECTVITRESG